MVLKTTTRNIYLIVLFLAMWLTMGWLAYKSYHSYQLIKTIVDRDARIIELRGLIVYLDEVLTSSTIIAAYTNDLKTYEERYLKHAYIDSTVSQMAEIADADIKKMIQNRIHQINKRLEGVEIQVFNYIREGETKKAQDIVLSKEYNDQKQEFQELIEKLDNQLIEVKEDLHQKKEEQYSQSIVFIVLCFLLFLLSLLVIYNFIKGQQEMQNTIGKKMEKDQKRFKSMSSFAENLGSGNYEVSLDIDEDDNLSVALVQMRDKLKQVAEEDHKRQWTTEGITKVSELLRGQTDLKTLGDQVISFLLEYIQANQGGIFVLNHDEKQIGTIDLISYYAFHKKKYIEQEFKVGQGLVGQAVKEGKMIYLTEIPEDYIQITSGLGQANPRCIAIVPMIFNEKVEGVLEIASFSELPDYKLAFLENIGEIIASTVSAMQVNKRTQILLEESQLLTNEMRQKEEEMRQNMEELMATQETAERREKELSLDLEKTKEQLRLISEERATFRALLKENNIVLP